MAFVAFEVGLKDIDKQINVRLAFCPTVTTRMLTAFLNNDGILQVQLVKQLDRQDIPPEMQAVCASVHKSSCS